MFWLGRALNDAGYQTLPAKSVYGAVELLSEQKVEVDLLAINPSLPGAHHLIAALRRFDAHVKVVATLEEAEQTPDLAGVDLAVPKPASADETARLRWIETIQDLLPHESGNEI